ncbi:DNA-binding protein [Streptomyces sp. NPDC001668]|uniref:nSTAND1 domain-containing NTPase n=1 Tax=unclassified Streptomyces TaxID=2593676 RepID=UPI0036956BCC
MAGRRESPLDPSAGPVARFAAELRKLRAEAGSPTYRMMAQRTGQGASTLSQAAGGERLPTLPVVLAYVRACGGDLEEWEERWREAASEVAAEPRTEDENAEPPYRGLARFEPADADLFFGRDQLTDRLLELSRSHRFTAVFGPSGSGKSSLLRAGLIPRLRTPDQAGPRPAALRVLTPGEHPLRTHKQRLTPKDTDGDTWLIVDQFEELYTLCTDPTERNQFIDRLVAATDPADRLRVVIAVRADFLGHCAAHSGLTAALQDASVLVGPMSRDELREAVVKPAQRSGLIVERDLTARILDEVEDEPGALPLMSHALLETWRRRKGRALTVEAYEAAGALRGAIVSTAEDAYARLTPAQADIARRILLRLVTPGEGAADTRRPGSHAELVASDISGELDTVLDQLIRVRLLTVDEDIVDLAHEALLTAWPRLRTWVDEDRERLRAHRRLTDAATTWRELEGDPGALYRGTRLATAMELWPLDRHGELTEVECAFLTASLSDRDQERRAAARVSRRLRQFTVTVSVLLILALIAGVLAWQQARTSDRRHVEAEARRIAAVAESMRISDPVRAMQLSVAAWRLTDTTETRSALLGAMAQRDKDVFAVPGADSGYSDGSDSKTRQLIDHGRAVMSVERGRIRIWDLATHRLTHLYRGPGKLLYGAPTVSPDGHTLALAGPDGIVLWDVRSAQATGKLSGTLWASDTAFGPSGHTLVVETQEDSASVQVWRVPDHRLLVQAPAAAAGTLQAAVSADDRWLALCSDKQQLQIWDLANHRKTPSPWTPARGRGACPADSLAFSPDNRTVAVLSDKGIHRWDLRSGRESARIEESELSGMWFSADGEFLAATDDKELFVWRLSNPDSPVFRQPLNILDVSDLGIDEASGTLRYLSGAGTIVRSLDLKRVMSTRWETQTADWSQLANGGRKLARLLPTADGKGLQILDAQGRVRFAASAPRCPSAKPGDLVKCEDFMAASPDGRYIAQSRVVDQENQTRRQLVTVWDTMSRRVDTTLDIEPGSDTIAGLAGFALDARGRQLAVYREDGAVEIWDVRRKKRVKTLAYHVSAYSESSSISFSTSVPPLAWRGDGKMLVTLDGTVFGFRSGRTSHRLLTDDQAGALAFSPNGAYLAVGDVTGRVSLWDGALHRRLGVLSGISPDAWSQDGGDVSALAFSHDGRTLAVGSSNGTVELWDVPSRRLLGSALPSPGDSVLSLTFNSDDSGLYTSGTNVPRQTYALDSKRLAEQVCRRAGSGLSRSDWKAYLPDISYRRTCFIQHPSSPGSG